MEHFPHAADFYIAGKLCVLFYFYFVWRPCLLIRIPYLYMVNSTNKKFSELKSILVLGFCAGVFFYVFSQHIPEKIKKTNSEKHHEYVLSHDHFAVSGNYKIRIYKPVFYYYFLQELSKTNFHDKNVQVQKAENNFLQVKILLKLNNYNLFFASGFHEPPLAA